MMCMDRWAECDPTSNFNTKANNTIRSDCAAKKPVDVDEALKGKKAPSGVVTDGVFAGGAGRHL